MEFYIDGTIDNINKEYSKVKNRIKNRKVHLIGMGGSYLGTKAILDIMQNDRINFVGPYLDYNFDSMSRNDYYIIVSKSGSTFEIEYILEKLESRVTSNNATIITDSGSPLEEYAISRGFDSIINTHKEIGGRFSAFDSSTLFPLAVAGIDISNYVSLINDYTEEEINNIVNARNEDFDIELVTTNNAQLEYFTMWYQQLFAESLGKDKLGLFPVTLMYPRDLHSVEQLIQDGGYTFLETNFNCGLDGISQLINSAAIESHKDSGIEVIEITDLKLNLAKDELIKQVGKVIYMFLLIVVRYAEKIGVNPFGQPGVENYKKKLRAHNEG